MNKHGRVREPPSVCCCWECAGVVCARWRFAHTNQGGSVVARIPDGVCSEKGRHHQPPSQSRPQKQQQAVWSSKTGHSLLGITRRQFGPLGSQLRGSLLGIEEKASYVTRSQHLFPAAGGSQVNKTASARNACCTRLAHTPRITSPAAEDGTRCTVGTRWTACSASAPTTHQARARGSARRSCRNSCRQARSQASVRSCCC